ncbi:MAG TPA: hypothetical protein VMZ03_09220 [Chitinophagaceae bacterium]|nr:hypothetical protein [Chitinophagaceae bacterium]
MSNTANTYSLEKWLHIFFGVGLLIVFFLPWVFWKDTPIHGYYMPSGRFFHISGTQFNLENPFPQFSFTFYIFWLIPILAGVTIILAYRQRRTTWTAFITAALTLSLVTVFYLFTKTLIDLGIGDNVFSMLKISAYLAAIFAIGLILTAIPPVNWLKKMAWLLVGPLFAFLGFMLVENYVWNETHEDTNTVKADYTVNASDLIRDFAANDTAANNKYREKILVVNGVVSQAEHMTDSTTNIQFADSTGSYIIFSFDKEQYEKVKNIQAGDVVSAKGSCSGSIFSEILGTTSISFKRSTLNKNKQ